MRDEIKWEDPPDMGWSRANKRRALVAALKAHPGKWAVWTERTKHPNTNAKSFQKTHGDKLELRAVRQEDGTCRVYARWNPEAIQKSEGGGECS